MEYIWVDMLLRKIDDSQIGITRMDTRNACSPPQKSDTIFGYTLSKYLIDWICIHYFDNNGEHKIFWDLRSLPISNKHNGIVSFYLG